MKQPRISVLAIGTELTNGQITNRNASWISARLSEMGVQTSGHFTVPDDRPLIQKALDLCGETSDLIFVTGGLGPTSDDFTREMIATWTGSKLVWDEASWTHIVDRLKSRGIAAKEIQRQQCFYPPGSVVLTNSQGTAHGFRLQAREKTFVVLPGPPREIEAIWTDHLAAWLPTQFPGLDPWIIRSWDTLGQPESEMAQKTEEALAGTDFERGYRVHIPYVEVKMSYPKSREAEAQKSVDKITQALKPDTVLRDGDEVTALLGKILAKYPEVQIVDEISGEYFWNRLAPHLTSSWRNQKLTLSNRETPAPADALVLSVFSMGPGEAKASLSYRGMKKTQWLESHYSAVLMKSREKQYFVELAALFWLRELSAI